MKLSAEQLAAIRRTGQNVCVVAGPGSGKTSVLVERFAWLVEECGIAPSRILAITFTEKAATEMKERLVKRISLRPELREAVERAWVSTIDGFCNRLLAENAIAAGYPPDFTVLDAPSAKNLLRESAEGALDALFVERPDEMRRLMEGLDHSTDYGSRQADLAESLCDVYEQMRLAGLRKLPESAAEEDVLAVARQLAAEIGRDPGFAEMHAWAAEFLALPARPAAVNHFEVLDGFKVNLNKGGRKRPAYAAAKEFKNEIQTKLRGQWAREFHTGLPELFRDAIARLDETFREAKRRQGVADFADLEEQAIVLLECSPDVRERVTARFDHVLMDELQDTNRLQWRLVDLIRRNFFAVGDINQSIYGFRHADRTVFEKYREEVRASGGSVDELIDNHRSRAEILDAVDRVLAGQEGIEPRTLTARGEFDPAQGPFVERFVGLGEQGEAAEAAMVAARIQQEAGEDRNYSRIAILVRTMSTTEPFEKALEKAGIPFLVTGGRTFLETRETKDLMNLLASLVNPLDDVAMLAVLRGPLMGWSDEEIFGKGRDAWLAEFERLFGKARQLAGFVPPDRLLAMALDECGYLISLSDRGRANVEKLLAWIRREHRQRPRPLAEALEKLESLKEAQAEAEAPPPEAANAVSIMSIHAAKGLEYPVVFLSGLHRGPDTRVPGILFSPDLGLGMKWRNPSTGEGVSDSIHTRLKDRQSEEEKAEESRLLYVAMTRAKHRLILSHAEKSKASRPVKLAAAITDVTEADHAAVEAAQTRRSEERLSRVELLAKPALAGQYDSSVAVTSVALFVACPRKYFLSRYLGLEAEPQGPPPQRATGAMELGVEVHRALAGEATESPEALSLADRFSRSDLGQRAARADRREHEFDFLLALEDVVLRGQIDLWFEEAGELLLVDYKTDRSEASAAEYSLQLRLYALALERYAGRIPDRAALCYLRSGNAVEVSLAPQDLEDARQAIRTLATAQDRLDFPMKPGGQCLRCGFYRNLCPGAPR